MDPAAPKGDHREFSRVRFEIKGMVHSLDRDKEEGCAEIQNLSHGGVMFISSSPLNKGERLDMTLYHHEFEIPLEGTVIWSEACDAASIKEFNYGLKFGEISSVHRVTLSHILSSNHDR